MPLTASRRPRRTSQHRLSQDTILAAAVALIESEGPEALSMRHLGSTLGVEAMSIYHHFASRDELLRAIGDRMLGPVGELELGSDWRDACRLFATALRNVAVTHPSTFRLLGLQPFDTPEALRPVERLMGVLVASGFSPSEALGIYRAVVSYARGYALAETTGFTVDAAHRSGRRRLAELPKDEFPLLAGRLRELGALTADDGYVLGLEGLLAGLRGPTRRVRRSARRAQSSS